MSIKSLVYDVSIQRLLAPFATPSFRSSIRCWMVTGISVAVIVLTHSQFSAADIAVKSLDRWTNVFAGREQTCRFEISTSARFTGRLSWVYHAAGRTIARGEQPVEIEPAKPAAINVRLNLPTVRSGIIFGTQLSLALHGADGGEPSVRFDKELWLFAEENPLSEKSAWLKEKNLALYDPRGETAKLFDELKVPYSWLRSVSAIEDLQQGILIVGEGISLHDHRALAEVLFAKPADGVSVLWLAPAEGSFDLGPVLNSSHVARVNWRREDVITEFDKRLDAHAWLGQESIPTSYFSVSPKRESIIAEVSDSTNAWPWLEVEASQSKSRLIFCGFKLIAGWAESPTPRALLVHILEKIESSRKDSAASPARE